jgi:hypothetical protein
MTRIHVSWAYLTSMHVRNAIHVLETPRVRMNPYDNRGESLGRKLKWRPPSTDGTVLGRFFLYSASACFLLISIVRPLYACRDRLFADLPVALILCRGRCIACVSGSCFSSSST